MGRRRATRPQAIVVDDEAMVLLDATKSLAVAGYDVRSASGGDGAFWLLNAFGNDVALLLIDVGVRGPTSGFDFVRLAAELWPSMAILATSARSCPEAADMPAGVGFLPKPYASDALLDSARRLMAARNPVALEALWFAPR